VLAPVIYVAYLAAGSVVVLDPSGQVSSAIITTRDYRHTQSLIPFPDGVFFAIPQLEGTVEVRCKTGERNQGGYVTGSLHTRLRVEPGCRLQSYDR